MYILTLKMYILTLKMYMLAPKMYILAPKMHILYILLPKMDKSVPLTAFVYLFSESVSVYMRCCYPVSVCLCWCNMGFGRLLTYLQHYWWSHHKAALLGETLPLFVPRHLKKTLAKLESSFHSDSFASCSICAGWQPR